MTTLLLTHADFIAPMDDVHSRICDGGIFVRDNVIEQVGPANEMPPTADRVIDLHGRLLLPGLVNTHHHLYQTLTRAIPGAQNAELFTWLKTLYLPGRT